MDFMVFSWVFSFSFILLFILITPKMLKIYKEQRRKKEEERIRKQQNTTIIEKEKLERELMKQKLLRDAEMEAKNQMPKFCQYCGTKFTETTANCPSCGAAVNQ